MGIELRYKIALITSTAISILVISLALLAFAAAGRPDSVTFIIAVAIIISYCLCLLFNFLCFTLAKSNKENRQAPGWISSYGIAILVFNIIALLVIAFICIAASTSLIANRSQVRPAQYIFIIVFLASILISVVAGIMIIVYFFKAKKINKFTLSSLVENIGKND